MDSAMTHLDKYHLDKQIREWAKSQSIINATKKGLVRGDDYDTCRAFDDWVLSEEVRLISAAWAKVQKRAEAKPIEPKKTVEWQKAYD